MAVTALQRYVVRQGDTPQTIAQYQLGDASKWRDIVVLNNLDHPYVADPAVFDAERFATGRVAFTLPGTSLEDYVIPAGTVLITQPDDGSEGIRFTTDAGATILASAVGPVYADITAVAAGGRGNVPAGAVVAFESFSQTVMLSTTVTVGVDDTGGKPGSDSHTVTMAFLANITNAEPTAGGEILKVAFWGMQILLPISLTEGGARRNEISAVEDQEARLYGQDVYLNEDGEIDAAPGGDLAVVAGVENVGAALWRRLKTPRGAMVYHPEYGSGLPSVVGEGGSDESADRAAVEAAQTVREDPRVASIEQTSVEFVGNNALRTQCSARLSGETAPRTFNLST